MPSRASHCRSRGNRNRSRKRADVLELRDPGAPCQPGWKRIVSGLSKAISITVDSANGKIYWTDETASKIQRANLDGSVVQDLVTGLSKPVGIGLDVPSGKIYWTDEGTFKVQRANLADGTGIQDLVTGLSKPVGLNLDLAAGHIYWGDQVLGKIQRSNLDGTSVTDVVASGAGAVVRSCSVPRRGPGGG